MLVRMAEAIGRLVLAGREMTRLSGFTARVYELIMVLRDLHKGMYKRTMVTTGSENTEDGMCLCVSVSVCLFICDSVYMTLCACICVSLCLYMCMCIYTVCTLYLCVCVYMYVCMYEFDYTFIFSYYKIQFHQYL